MHTFIPISPMPRSSKRPPQGEFPATTLMLAGVIKDKGQLSPTQRADLNRLAQQGRLLKVGRTYMVNGLRGRVAS